MKTQATVLNEMLGRAVEAAEVPYRANRRAVRQFDILGEEGEGRKELAIAISGIDVFIRRLEDLNDAAINVVRHANESVR